MSIHKLLLAMLVLFSLTVIGCSGADGEKEKKPEAEAEAGADAGAEAGADEEDTGTIDVSFNAESREICRQSFTTLSDKNACQKSAATPEQVTKCVNDNPADLTAAAAAAKAAAEKAALACVKTAGAPAKAAAEKAAAEKAAADAAAAAAAAAAAEEPAAE